MKPKTLLGALLRDRRLKAGLTVGETATLAGVSQGHVTKLELGQVPATRAVLDRLARALACEETDLYLAAGIVPSQIATSVEESPDLFLLLSGLSVAERRRLHGELASRFPAADSKSRRSTKNVKNLKRKVPR